MTNVVSTPKPLESEDREVLEALATLTKIALEFRERLDKIEAQLPPRPLVLSDDWITVKAAGSITGFPDKTIYRWARAGLIDSTKLGGKRAINRVDLERHIALRN